MRLKKLSMQFSTQETDSAADAMETYERLILDAMRGDHTLFTTAEGIKSLWERSVPLLEDPPPIKVYGPGTWGPNSIHQLIAPNAWRLPFERAWRTKIGCGLLESFASGRPSSRVTTSARSSGQASSLPDSPLTWCSSSTVSPTIYAKINIFERLGSSTTWLTREL
ncbi:MAG: hypothetical protein ACRDR6_15980 [Pseudonocardiaceae bacterium]